MKYLYPEFFNNIKKHDLIKKGDTVISAFSGGKDSVTLLLLLRKLQNDIAFNLKAAYFNHKLRDDSNNEEKWVEDYLNLKNIDLIKGTSNVISFKSRNKLNLENAASISRYDFLKRVSNKFTNAKIATGHSKSDLTETFFIKLFRGSGLQGLSGIYGLKGEKIIRPLLIFSKSDILEFLKRSGEEFYTDPTNKINTFMRNNIRNNLIPEIEKIERGIDNHIFRTVTIIQEEFEFFRTRARDFLLKNLICDQILPVKKFNKEPLALKRHIIREFIRFLKGNLMNIDFEHIEKIIQGGSRTGISIPGINFIIRKGFIYPEKVRIPGYNYTVDSPGVCGLGEIGTEINLHITENFKKPENNFEIIIPCSGIIFPLTIRNASGEDKYKKINSNVKQKVFEMIRATGIPATIRNLLPVIINRNKEIIWVFGSPVSDDFKVADKKNGNYLTIKTNSPLTNILKKSNRGGRCLTS